MYISRRLEVYDLGLSADARRELSRWRDVRVVDFADAAVRVLGLASAAEIPVRLLDASSYCFKPVVVADALARHGAVLWLDANVELRRPLEEVRHLIAEQGHFLVQHPYRFPTPQFHFPAAVAALECEAVDLSREHCATTFVGATRRGWFARDVLPRLLECAAREGCINPAGSSRANHRQEQTALNAILCARREPEGVCSGDTRFRMTSDFENDHHPQQPTADETDWNAVVFYTRRNHPLKPYSRFLQRRRPNESSERLLG